MALTVDGLEFWVSEPSDNALVVFSARKMLKSLGFDLTGQYLIASAVSELSTNIIRYGNRGVIRLRPISGRKGDGIEIIAEDEGPGIADISKALEERFSTGGGLGLGLPSIRRIMDEFEIRSARGEGTWIRVVKWMVANAGD